jgi:DNA modification methylase
MAENGSVAHGKDWIMCLGDCVAGAAQLPENSIGLSVFSPPFSQLYIYSDSICDMGNCADDSEFFQHFGYLIPELYRVTIPGRLCAIHCKDLPKYRGSDGNAGLRDFPGKVIAAFESHGWTFHSRVTIWKCPVTERERTNNNGLLHKTVMRDSSQIRQGMADYVVVLRKPPADEAAGNLSAVPIERPEGLERWVGEPALDPRETDFHPSKYARHGKAGKPSVELWRRYAEPVWWDIDQTDVLNHEMARGNADEKHICPLQLGVIRRIVYLWSQEGDVVMSPFAGIGSEGVVAIEEDRRFLGFELNANYYKHACRYIGNAETSKGAQMSLLPEMEEAEDAQAV